MTTRRKFTGKLLAAGALANFALVAGVNGVGPGNKGNPCNGHGKADQCHGHGAKADTVNPPSPCRSNARVGQDHTPQPMCTTTARDHVE